MPDNIIDVKIDADVAQAEALLSNFATSGETALDNFAASATAAFDKFAASSDDNFTRFTTVVEAAFEKFAASMEGIKRKSHETEEEVSLDAKEMGNAIAEFAERARVSGTGVTSVFSAFGSAFAGIAIVSVLGEFLDQTRSHRASIDCHWYRNQYHCGIERRHDAVGYPY
jgi:hypothetical protein